MISDAWMLILVLSVLYSIGFLLLGLAIRDTWRSTRPKSWPTTPGVIRELTLRPDPSPPRTGSILACRFDVRYTYSVNGEQYEGTRLAFGYDAGGGDSEYREMYRKLKASKEVSVRYDPANPSLSCLTYGFHRSIKYLWMFALLLFAFTAGATYLFSVFTERDRVLLENLSLHRSSTGRRTKAADIPEETRDGLGISGARLASTGGGRISGKTSFGGRCR